ncbi:MAG: outer membrane beta-barrel protein [Pseudomonadota bacterium]
MQRTACFTAMVALAALGASGARAASADGGGWYLTAGAGTAPRLFLRSDLNDALVDEFKTNKTPLTLDASSVSKHNSTWSAGVGYWFAENLAVEAAYLKVGKVHYHAAGSADISGTATATDLELDARSRGGSLALVWTAPLWNAWGAELRAGAFMGKTNTHYTSTVGEDVSADVLSKKNTTPMLGAGGSYAATAHLVLKLQYAHLFGIKEEGLENKFAADVVTLGLAYVF